MERHNKLYEHIEAPTEDHWLAIENKARQDSSKLHDLKIAPPESCWTNIASRIGMKADEPLKKNGSLIRASFSEILRYAAIVAGVSIVIIGLTNNTIRNRFENILLENNLKTSLSDTQYILPLNKKKTDTSIQNSHDKHGINKLMHFKGAEPQKK